MTEYNEIVALVHPIYDAIYTDKNYYDLLKDGVNPNTDAIINKTKKGKQLTIQIKKTLGIYGEFLNQQLSKKNTCVVIYLPSEHKADVPAKYVSTIFDMYKFHIKTLKNFILHYKKKFGDRIYISNYSKSHESAPFLSQKILDNLGKSVTLTLFGEYYNPQNERNKGCVHSWGTDLVSKLAFQGVTVKHMKILTEKTLPFKSKEVFGFRKVVLPANEKRALQNKEKKRKLKIKRPR